MKKKILVLDDSPLILDVVGDQLRKLNYDVTTVGTGTEACRIIETTRFDMIITDLNMPGMDGLEFTKHVREQPGCRFVPIVMLSSEKDSARISRARALGISTFLGKPLNLKQLHTLLQIALNKRRAQRVVTRYEVLYGEEGQSTDLSRGVTFNLSTGGVFIETSSPLLPDTILNLTLDVPGENPISCRGRVAWVSAPAVSDRSAHPSGMGIEFLHLDDEQKLQEILAATSRRS